jgi:integrase
MDLIVALATWLYMWQRWLTEKTVATALPSGQPTMKKTLTDRTLKALKPAAKPYEVMDAEVKGFGIRVLGKSEAPVKSFILFRRFPGSKNPVRRTLGAYGDLTLAEAREKAREWNALVKKGVHPAIEERRVRVAAIEAERAKQVATYGAALGRYLEAKAKLRSSPHIKRELTGEFVDWLEKPIADIHARDVKAAIQGIVNRGTPTQAHFVFGMLRTFFNWVVDSGDFGLELSPCAKIKPGVLIGARNIRTRVLKDFELAAYWRASEVIGYPFGRLFQLLALTALRRDEASEARWGEIDLEAKLWVVPESRMKNAAAHAVSLTSDILQFLESLPRFSEGDYLFSTTRGRRPVSGFSKAKKRLDRLMCEDFEAQGKSFEQFVLHDVRRTCRTKFSALPVEETVRELLVAHARPGLHKVYDLHAYETEKAHALTLWHAKLRAIVTPRPDNVIRLDEIAASGF